MYPQINLLSEQFITRITAKWPHFTMYTSMLLQDFLIIE
jgi:hypothetical protein